MAESAAIIGFTTMLAVESSPGSGTFSDVGEVTAITPPGQQVNSIDVTHMASPSGIKEFIPGLTDPGECQLSLNWIPGDTSDAFIRAWLAARERRACRITFPTAATTSTWTFDGFPTSYSGETPMDDKMSASLTVKVSGATTVA